MSRELIPEWRLTGPVIVAWPDATTDWEYMLDEARTCFAGLIRTLVDAGEEVVVLTNSAEDFRTYCGCGEARVVEVPINDTWTRDYCPLPVATDEGTKEIHFGFNGWGLKFASDRDNRAAAHLPWAEGVYVDNTSLVLEGGSIETDGFGTVLTTSRCILSKNRNGGMDRATAEERLKDLLGAKKVIMLDHGALAGDDTDSHIDTLARFAPDRTILYVGCDDPTDEHYPELEAMKRELESVTSADGRPYRLVALPMAPAMFEDGERLPSTYANFLVTNRNVLVPTYGHPGLDDLACRTIGECYPGRNVVGVDCRALVRQHGSLHCSTMQLASPDMLK